MPSGFKEKDIIRAIIVKNLEGDYFFYGIVESFSILNKKEFIKKVLNKMKIEDRIRKERETNEIEWEIER